jgi:AcrR family transcriptional regulator
MADDGEPARERVLRVASELFSEHGFHAVGIDLIIERAGVAKATLYRHFPTKDDLIAASLDATDQRFWAWFEAAVDTTLDPAETLARLFDAVATLATSPTCLGCSFQKAAAEFPERVHPGHLVALTHKDGVRDRLRQLAVDAGASHPDQLADALLLVMDGAFASARMYGPDNPGRHAGAAARALIEDQVRRPARARAR